MEHNLVDILTDSSMPTQQDQMTIKGIKYIDSPLVIATQNKRFWKGFKKSPI